MTMQLNATDAQWNEMRSVSAASIASNFTKIGVALTTASAASAATDSLIVATAHAVVAKDFVMFYQGGEESEPRHAESVSADIVTLGEVLTGTPSAGEGFVSLTPTVIDAVSAGTTDTVLVVTAHSATSGAMLWFVDGGEVSEPRLVASQTADAITLDAALTAAPSATEEFGFVAPTVLNAATSTATTDTIIHDADHTAVVGDIFVMSSGDELDEFRVVLSSSAATFTLNEALSGTPTATETYNLFTPTTIDAAEAGASTTKIFTVAHSAAVGDQIIMTTGGEDGEGREIASITADSLTLSVALSGTPSPTEAYNVTRPQRQHHDVGAKMVHMANKTNQPVEVSYDKVKIAHRLIATESRDHDYHSNNLGLQKGSDLDTLRGWVYLRARGTAPTTGDFEFESNQ